KNSNGQSMPRTTPVETQSLPARAGPALRQPNPGRNRHLRAGRPRHPSIERAKSRLRFSGEELLAESFEGLRGAFLHPLFVDFHEGFQIGPGVLILSPLAELGDERLELDPNQPEL